MMYTWSRQRGPTSTASGIPAPMETGLAAGEDRPWTGDTLNGSANRGARGVIVWLHAQGIAYGTGRARKAVRAGNAKGVDRGPGSRTRGRGISHVRRSYRSDARPETPTRADRRAAPKWRQGILRPRDTDGRWPRSRRRWDAAKF